MRLTESLVIGMVQLTQPVLTENHLPYAVGLLEAYVRRHAAHPGRFLFLPPLYRRQPVQQAVQQLQLCDVVGFSTYVWNMQYSLAIARELKRQRPHVLIVMGGPQIPESEAEDFLRAHPYVDLAVHGEGEAVFLQILERLPERRWDEIPSLSHIDATGTFQQSAKAPRIRDLSNIPSPYLEGVFEPLIRANPTETWMALWETNRGCPFSCTFCDWGSATQSKIYQFDMPRLEREMLWFAKHKIRMVYCCDANFGILPRDLEITEKVIQIRRKQQYPKIFYIQTAKNVTERAYSIQKMLFDAQMNTAATLSLQSITPTVLDAIRRSNISLNTFQELQNRFKRDHISSYTDMLIGLPGDSYDTFADGIANVIASGQHQELRLYNVYILPNAEMAQAGYRQVHHIKTIKTPYLVPFSTAAPPADGIYEEQELLVENATMTRHDWVRMRTLAWMVQVLYYQSRPLQIPLLLMHTLTGISMRTLFEAHIDSDLSAYPTLASIRDYLRSQAERMLQGEPEYCVGPQPGVGDVWMPPDYLTILGLFFTHQVDALYREALSLYQQLLAHTGAGLPDGLLAEAMHLNQLLFQAHFPQQQFTFNSHWNLWEYLQGVMQGQEVPLQTGDWHYVRDWEGEPYFQLKTLSATTSQLSDSKS
jgi:hypothetical protein